MSLLKGLVCLLKGDVLFRESHVTFFMGAIMWKRGGFKSCLVLSRRGKARKR